MHTAPDMIQKSPMIPPPGSPATSERIELLAGHRKAEECRAFPCSIILERDAVVMVRQGAAIRADIYRPKTEEKVPAIIMWGPYGKSGNGKSQWLQYRILTNHSNSGILNLESFPSRAGIPKAKLSGYESFEG